MRYCYNWRKQTDKLQAASKVLSDPDLQAMLATLELDHPSRQQFSVPDAIQGMKMLGMIEGYQRCLDLFRSLATPVQDLAQRDIESTFGSTKE
jgi:hypothetical protein